MTRRSITGCVTLLAVALLAGPALAQDGPPRTPWGHADLQGVWDFRTITPMERPEDQADREFLSDEEVANLEQEVADRNADLAARPAQRTLAAADGGDVDEGEGGAPGAYNNFWFDRGTQVIATGRTSLVTDPPTGRIPALTPEAERKQAEMEQARQGIDDHTPTPGGWVEDLGANGLQARCITGFNSGPPMTPSAYNNNMQLFQTRDTVVVYNEMNHNPRIIPLDGRPFTGLKQWVGESRGHWEGDTLVVRTKNFLRETSFMRGGSTAGLELTERFTRAAPDVLLYEVTVNDPNTWTGTWTYEVPMRLNSEPIYEYACHEGNYAMETILSGALTEGQ